MDVAAGRMEERILVVPRALLLSRPLHGFVPGPVHKYLETLARGGTFLRRGDVEEDDSLKQIIPYLIVRHGERIFLFQRSQRGAEGRLRGLYSIGVGGHIAEEDAAAEGVLYVGMRRELEEELVLEGGWDARPVGVLNDDENPVGRVHFGIVFVVDVSDPHVRVRETDRLSGFLAARSDVVTARERMETWSRFILEAADPFAL